MGLELVRIAPMPGLHSLPINGASMLPVAGSEQFLRVASSMLPHRSCYRVMIKVIL